MSLIAALTLAYGADVIWLDAPDESTRSAVQSAAGGRSLDAMAFRAGGADVSPEDDAALRSLASALEAVRPYEQQLDGELLILRDLQRPIDMVTLVRDETDRNALFAALAYQGFAVDRFYGEDLATADDAAPHRAEYSGVAVPTPWRDAVALEPERSVSPYDIAEAPQRIRYAEVQQVVMEQLPASLLPGALPDGGEWMVDGRSTAPDGTGSIKVPPGRHLVHVKHGDHVLQRWDLRVEPGSETALDIALSDDVWQSFVDGLTDGSVAPDALAAALEHHGEVWLARGAGAKPQVFSVSRDGAVTAVDVQPASQGGEASSSGGPTLQLGAVGGWTGSHDFYYQDPTAAPPDSSTVNAGTIGGTVGLELPMGPLRLGGGIDVLVPLGEHHAARTGDADLRVRPVPHVSFGLQQAALALGYAFPHHPAAGLRGSQRLVGPLEARWLGWFGIPTTVSREGAEDYEFQPLGMAAVGLGLRL